MRYTQSRLNDLWDNLQKQENALKCRHAENTLTPPQKIVRDDEVSQVISLLSEDGVLRRVYSRFPGELWIPIHYVAPENMTIEERRKEIEKLADAHRDIVKYHENFGRRFSPKDELSPGDQTELNWLIKAEVQARAEYIAASTRQHEPGYL